MDAWTVHEPGDLTKLAWGQKHLPEPGPDQVRVQVKAACLNFPDILVMQGKYQFKPEPPFVPGSEFAGVIEAVGSNVTGLALGQRVACMSSTGAYATHALVDAKACALLPDAFDFVDAAAFFTIYATSWHGLIDRAALKAGETVLVLGAAGGVGTSAIQIAKAAGARVIAAASTDEKCAACTALGADATINYTRHQVPGAFREALKAATDGGGPDVIYDPVGGAFSEAAFRSIAWRGRHLVVGFASGPIPSLPLNLLLLKGASLVGVFWGEFTRKEPDANRAMLDDLMRWYAEGKIKPVIDRTLPMQELHAACERMLSRGVTGKLVLTN